MKQQRRILLVLSFIFLSIPFSLKVHAENRLQLSALIKEALRVSPMVAAVKAAWEAEKARVDRVNVLADPEIGFDSWNIPNTFDLNETRNWIFFARQRFPAAGTLDLRAKAAEAEATRAEAEVNVTVRSIVAAVKIAYDDLYLAHKAIEVNAEHIEILKRFEEIAEIKYQTGAVPDQDVLKARVALAHLENDRLMHKQRLRTVQAALNTLLKRPPRAVLGKPEDLGLIDTPLDLEALVALALNTRPELKAAEAATRSSAQDISLAKLKFKPDYQVSVKRFQNHGTSRPNGWGISASINVPWFFHEKHDQRIQEKQHRTTERAMIYENLKDQTRQAVEDLIVRMQTAKQSAKLIQDKIIGQAEQSVRSAETGYETDQVDFLDLLESQRQLIASRLAYFRALTLQNQEAARLEQVIGINLSDLKNETHGGPK